MVTSVSVLAAKPIQRTFAHHDQIPLEPKVLWKIERGIVRTSTWSEDGAITPLGFWGPGDVVGSPLRQVHPYQIECLTSVEATQIPAHLWYQALDAILLHIQQGEELLSIAHSQRVHHRLIQFLTWLGQKFGRPVNGGHLIDLRLTHQEIAESLGTSRVTITRLLNKLEPEGLIWRSRRYLTLQCDYEH